MFKLHNNNLEEIPETTFKDLGISESDLEELLRKNIDIVGDEEQSMLIIGQQVRNAQNGRSDLTAIDQDGNLVLIEIKRDKEDMIRRKESMEFQSIRYAASYGTIQDIDELISKIYMHYVEKHKDEFDNAGSLTYSEIAARKLNEFLEKNNVKDDFNEKQSIILVASDFDEHTLSAVAWLNKNGVSISCYKLIPFRIDDDIFIQSKKVLPLDTPDQYFIDISPGPKTVSSTSIKSSSRRKNLPKIKDMIEWGAVNAGDIITPRDYDKEATLLENGNIIYEETEYSIHNWLKKIYGWSTVATYRYSIHKKSGKSLKELRSEYMNNKKVDDY